MAGARFEFVLDCFDHDGRRVLLQAPLLFVAAHLGSKAEKTKIVDAYKTADKINAVGQSIAMAPSTRPGDTAYETVVLRFTGVPGDSGELSSDPHLVNSVVVVPAMRHLAPTAPEVTVSYAEPYLTTGSAGRTPGHRCSSSSPHPAEISFGSTDSSGGFIKPDLPVEGLSRALGTVGDIDSLVTPADPALPFDPTEFLAGVFPKLFGLFDLVDILAAAGLDKAPAFVTEQLDAIAALLSDLDELRTAVTDGVTRTAEDAVSAATDTLRAQAEAARARLDAVRSSLDDLVADLVAAIDALLALDTPSDLPAVTAAVGDLLDDLRDLVDEILAIVAELPLPPLVKAQLERLAGATAPLLAVSKVVETIEAIANFVNGFDPSAGAVRARFQWQPTLTNFPATATNQDDALFFVDPQGFTLSIEARASGTEGVGVDVLAELRDFGLNLFPGEPLIRLNFDRMAFRAPSGRKPEVDVVFDGIEWLGVPRLHLDPAGAHPVRRLQRPAVRRGERRRCHRRIRPGPAQRRRRRLQPGEHQPRCRRERAVPRRRRHRRLRVLHPGEAVPAHGHDDRRRRLRRDPALAQGPGRPGDGARGRGEPVDQPRRRVRLGVGDDRDLPPARGSTPARSPATSASAARSTCSASSPHRSRSSLR